MPLASVVGIFIGLFLLKTASPSVASSISLPGAEPFPEALQIRLAQALKAKGEKYVPRTHHLQPDGTPTYTNRLILEPSPYLLQHAHNPLNWYPWGAEAFARAKKENKPILLSIGYSTCHWCHVMERESFEDLEIATYLNQHYIAIKVDREQRPDLDGIYMTAVQTMTGRGGWPMTVWLNPDREPFYGGTYFPPRDGGRGVQTGFLTLLKRLREVYDQQPAQVQAAAKELRDILQQSLTPQAGQGLPDATVLRKAAAAFAKTFDPEFGGFGRAPKFPRSVVLEFLLRYSRRTGDTTVRNMVVKTLEAMANGGMYDHIGGGFHRYATDREWQIPHFEKMLYDNALLTLAYLDAFQVTGRTDFADIAREILDYVSRDMTAPQGGFYSATDADSDGKEGAFFAWTPAQIKTVLDAQAARLVIAYYGVTEQGNFEGKNILRVARPLAEVAKELQLDLPQAKRILQAARQKLYQVRQKRPRPLTDTKVLTSWNGLMISAFARAGQVLNAPEYVLRATRAADFLLSTMKIGQRLRRSALDGVVSGEAYLDDYAFLAAGLLDVYEATFELRWLRQALTLQQQLDARFWDNQAGGYFMTGRDTETVLAREKPHYDGAEPSGNSVAIQTLLRLAELTTDDLYRQRAKQALQAFIGQLKKAPDSGPRMLAGVDFLLDAAKEIVIVKPNQHTSAEPLLARLRQTFVPNRVLSIVAEGDDLAQQQTVIPVLEGKTAMGGHVTAYVCEKQVCGLPTTKPDVFASQIAQVAPLPSEP